MLPIGNTPNGRIGLRVLKRSAARSENAASARDHSDAQDALPRAQKFGWGKFSWVYSLNILSLSL